VTPRDPLGPHPCNAFALILGLPLGSHLCKPFALVVSPRLGLRQPITEASTEMASNSWMHLRFLSLFQTTDLMFFRLGSGSTELCTSRSILATVFAATGTEGVERSHTRVSDEPPPPCASHQFWMRRRNVWFGTSSKEASICIVVGHVWFPASSHGSMLLRS